jgi:hypothetical protein
MLAYAAALSASRRNASVAIAAAPSSGDEVSIAAAAIESSRRAAILEEFRTSGRILQLFAQGLREVPTILPASN